WLGPFGQSHLFLKLPTNVDHIIRVYIHTAVSSEILESLTAFVNGKRCAQQGQDWGADGIATHWCLVTRDLFKQNKGIAKVTWSVLPALKKLLEKDTNSGQKMIAFSRVQCDSYPVS